jgi:hypothetical protein
MRSVLFAASLFVLAGAALAQSDRGTITGTVSDPAGALVPGAAIEAKNAQTGAQYQTISTATGNYTLAQLPAGPYQLSVTLPGFKTFLRQGITVNVAQTHRIDVTLEVGALTESVTVSADAPLLKTESGELSHNVTAERLNDLPVLGVGASAAGSSGIRNPYAVTQLAPGTLWLPNNSVRLNGTPANSQTMRVEGQDATNGFANWASAQTQPSVDAIQEFAIQTSNYAAEFGQAGGGVFNITMRSGTNQFHGSAYDYWVNEALNASTPFSNVKPLARRHNYGFTLGGPVWIPRLYDGHDKTFFFFNFEQFRETTVINNQFITVPTDAFRDGDFSALLTGRVLAQDPLGRNIIEGMIFDPATEKLVDGKRVRDPFPNNRIPLDRMDPVALKIQSMIPRAQLSRPTSNAAFAYPSDRVTSIPAFKIDQNLNSTQKLAFYWSATRTASQFSPTLGQADGLPAPITAARGTFIDSYTMRLNYDNTLTPTLLFHLGVGFMHNSFNDNAPTLDFDPVKDLGIPAPTTPRNFPTFGDISTNLGGMKAMGPAGLGSQGQTESLMIKPSANVSATWVKNNHTYKFGAEGYVAGYPNINRGRTDGLYNFSADQTAQPYLNSSTLSGAPVGFPYASFLLGRTSLADVAAVSRPRLGKMQWAMFAQDTWKITRKLTLDYGLRWDYGTYQREQYGRHPSFSPTTPNPSAGGLPGGVIFDGFGPGRCNCDFASNYPYAFGPRLGVAYQMAPKTVLRAGWGISYGTTPDNNQGTQSISSGNPISPSAFGNPAVILSQGIPLTADQIAWPNYDAGLYPLKGSPSIGNFPTGLIDPNAGRPPRIMQWSIGIQRELSDNLAVEVSYVGNRGAWWQANGLVDYNGMTPERLRTFGLDLNSATDRQLLISPLNSPLAAQRGFNKAPYQGFPLGENVVQSLRPFPQFKNIPALWAPLGRTWYDSLQAKVTKRYSHGLDFTYTFTWQKELTMGVEGDPPGFGAPAAAATDVYNRGLNKFISGYSRPFVSVLAANYRLPAIGGQRWLSWAVRDWQLGAVLQYSSGQPIRVPLAQNLLNTYLLRSGGLNFANRVPGEPLFTQDLNCHCFDPSTTFVLNPKAWQDPLAGQWGASPAYYNDYRQARRPNESMSLGRMFRFGERASFEVRAEFSNIFNRTFINNPTSTNARDSQRVGSNGQTIAGFGRINPLSPAPTPRQGTIVARVRF